MKVCDSDFPFDRVQLTTYHRAPMSETVIPSQIEPDKWADRAAIVEAELPLKQFTRLLDGAHSDVGTVAVNLKFSRDARRFARMQGTLTTQVSLTCQRCLDPVDVAVVAEVDVYLLAREQDCERLDEEEDFVVYGEGRCFVHDVIEDELILALPLVPRHDVCAPHIMAALAEKPEADVVVEKRENPFDVLADLKKQLH